jgi:hypothetical protein
LSGRSRGPIFLDTSVLLGGLVDLGESAVAAQNVMTAIAQGRLGRPHTAWHCCLEFYSVSTRLPEEFRLSPDDALLLLEREVFGRFAVHQLGRAKLRAFMAAAAADGIAGGRIYDVHIAEIAREAGAGVVITENVRHFGSLVAYGMRVETAVQFSTSLQ